ncbi:MAG: hypothetical protein EBS30_11465, partial [Planctomycetes bacterium]|nr:hypothetical protein [Planctomycetota bacterium]
MQRTLSHLVGFFRRACLLDKISQLRMGQFFPAKAKPRIMRFGYLEPLEDRLVPAVSFTTDPSGSILFREDDPLGMGSGNAGQGDGKDNLELRVNVDTNSLEYQWTAPDRVGGSQSSGWQQTNWDISVADATKTRTIQIKVSGDVTFTGSAIVSLGSSLVIDGKMTSGGQTWDSARSPDLIRISTDIKTCGGNLSIYNAGSITVDPGKIISTRMLAHVGTNDATTPSRGNSGSIVLQAENPDKYNSFLNASWTDNVITIGAKAKLFAHAVNSGGTEYTEGDITVTSANTDIILFAGLGGTNRSTRIDIESGAGLFGNNITVSAKGGELDATVIDGISRLISNWGENPGGFGFLANLLPLIGFGASQFLDLPINVDVRIASAEVNVKDTIDDNSSSDVPWRVTYSNDDSRTLIDGSGNVKVNAFSRSTAFGNARMMDTGTIGAKLTNALGSFGFAIGFLWSEPKAIATIGQNVRVNAGTDLVIESEIHALAQGKALVTSNTGNDTKNNITNNTLAKMPLVNGFAAKEDTSPATRYDRKQLATSMQIIKSTSTVLVDTGADLVAGGNARIMALGKSENSGISCTTSFGDGQGGMTFTFGNVTNDITTTVNGSVTSQAAAAAKANVVKTATINPFKDIDYTNNRVRVNNHGYSDGDNFVYDPGKNKPIPGLESGVTYIAGIDASWSSQDKTNYFKIYKINDGGSRGDLVTFQAPPGLVKSGTFYGFASVDPVGHALMFPYDPGLATGDSVTYRGSAGKSIDGLTDGAQYVVVADPSPFFRYYLIPVASRANAQAVASAALGGYTNGRTIGTDTFRGYQTAYNALKAEGSSEEEAVAQAQLEAMIAADNAANATGFVAQADIKAYLTKSNNSTLLIDQFFTGESLIRTATAHGLVAGDAVTFKAPFGLTVSLAEQTTYYAIPDPTDSTGKTLWLASTQQGAINAYNNGLAAKTAAELGAAYLFQ